MDAEQKRLYGEIVDKWKEAVVTHGVGWDEDDPEIPVEYPLDVDMVDYYLGGAFEVDIGPADTGRIADTERLHLIATPHCDILARVTKVKAHMSRMITAMENARDQLIDKCHQPPNTWEFVELATMNLKENHHGTLFRTQLESKITQPLKAHCTGLPSSLPWDVGYGFIIEKDGDDWAGTYVTKLRSTMFTVCPFVLYETNGKQSHTQRSHITIELKTTSPVFIRPIMGEITTRMVPVMSNMQIPDEVVQVLKAYAGPTFTEDASVRVIKILRGITAEFCPDGDVIDCRSQVFSEDSHLAHSIRTSISNDLQ